MNKIILLSFDYPPNNGGISRLCNEIVREFEARGIAYEVVTNVPSVQPEKNVTRIVDRRGKVELKILAYIRESTSKDDIIICDTWHPAGSLAMLSGRRFYILAHGAEFLPGISFFRKKIVPAYRRLILKKSQGIIANSRYTAALVNSLAKGLNVHAIPLAIDSATFKPGKAKNTDDDILRLCSISRLEKFKGHDFILSVIAGLPESYRQRIRLQIGGKGPFKPVLEQMVSSLHLEKIVSFLGFLPEQEMNDFYSGNDLFILCTREEKDLCNVEGFGLVFVEAQACGTAVIGTNAGGIPDAICNGRGGWLIPQDSADELSALLKYCVDNKERIQKEGVVARQRVVNECSQSKYVDAVLKVINE